MTGTQRFLYAAQANVRMEARVRACASFEELARAAHEFGFRRRAAELRAAFAEGVGREPVAWREDIWAGIQPADAERQRAAARKRWNSEQARYAEVRYRRFLYLRAVEAFDPVPAADIRAFLDEPVSVHSADAARATAAAYESTFREPYFETAGAALLRLHPFSPALARVA